jgi:hypothetical protein
VTRSGQHPTLPQIARTPMPMSAELALAKAEEFDAALTGG